MEGGHILSSPLLRKSLRRKHKCWVRSGVGRRKKNELSLRKLDSRRIRASRGCMGVATGADSTVRKCKNQTVTWPRAGWGEEGWNNPVWAKPTRKPQKGTAPRGRSPYNSHSRGSITGPSTGPVCPADTRGYTPTPVLLAALLASFLQKPETNSHGRAIW